jgi:hypothetical protein
VPEMIYVDSKNVEAIGYDSESMQLHVRFLKSGETYIYFNVEPWVFEEFKAADSKGTFLNQRIRKNYEFSKA